MKSNIVKGLNELSEKDVYSMLLFSLYKLKDDPQYAVLSELIYLVDKDSLMRLLSVMEGITIKIPKVNELKTLVAAMELYQLVNMQGVDFRIGMKEVKTDELYEGEIKQAYISICKTLEDYDFKRGDK